MIGILLIATRKYKMFVEPLIQQIEKYFLTDFEIEVHLFIDESKPKPEWLTGKTPYRRVRIIEWFIPPYSFPFATLYRYKTFSEYPSRFENCSHLVYLDADSGIVGTVGEEILVDGLMAVRHPGFYASDLWGSEGNPETSTSEFPKEKRRHYYCGGTQGGKTEYYLEACKVLADRIDEDEKNSVRAIHNDETHWNKWCSVDRPELVTEFTPSYCMVEQPYLRKNWGIDNLDVKIIALSKDHKSIRE